jgi:tryptophanyl-tRNA synthetase
MRVMSGMRTTGALHIGHYFGALKNWLALQEQHTCYFGIMDWHGMTTNYKLSSEISAGNREMFAEFVAWGIDVNRSRLFVQSLVPEHLELFFIFANLTPMGWLERVPTWKDAEEEAKASDTYNLGRFSYPVLQAADVAIYKGQSVPVGQDQVAHLELTREIIRRFNHLYKAKWPEPKPLLTETPMVLGIDGRKMSKSYNNGLGLTEEKKSVEKKIKGMPTDPARVRREDPGDPAKCNVFSYHKLFSTPDDLAWVTEGCTTAGIGCGDCKARLHLRMEDLVSPARERKKELLNNPKLLDSMIGDSSTSARTEAQANLREIKELMKLI